MSVSLRGNCQRSSRSCLLTLTERGDARRGVITHLTIAGERVAAIVPESVLDALRAAEDAEDAAEADASWDDPGEDVPWEQVKAEPPL